MANYSGSERLYRVRTRNVREDLPRQDAVASALTAQVVLCILLILCFLLVKKIDATAYGEIKQEYSSMLVDKGEMTKLKEWVLARNIKAEGIFIWFEQFANELKPNTEEKAFDLSNAEDEPIDEPQSKVADTPASIIEDEGKQAGDLPLQMEFDYLKENEEVLYMSAAGGLNPVNVDDISNMEIPPKGSTLMPVYLNSKIKPPVSGVITSGFAYRYHPVTGTSDFHTGIDVAANEGTPILAALPGEVVEVGESQVYGNYIVLQHASNLRTSYAHCSKILASEGMAVRQGERIALVGETGVATGPHLHFSVIVDGEFTDPRWVLKDYIKVVE